MTEYRRRGPGKLCEALGITIAHSELPLDRPPIALYARTGKVDIVSGVRIGITKALDLPWRYGLKDLKFLSKPFPTEAAWWQTASTRLPSGSRRKAP